MHRRSSAVVTMGTGWMEETPTAAATKEWMMIFVYDPTLCLVADLYGRNGKKGYVEKVEEEELEEETGLPRTLTGVHVRL